MKFKHEKSGNIVLIIIGFSLVLFGCANKQQGTLSHTNENECRTFINTQRSEKHLYYSGQSKWKSNINEAKLQALQKAKVDLASSLHSYVSTTCVETIVYESNQEKSKEKMKHACQTVTSTKKLDVSSLSKDVSFCLEEKVYYQSSKQRTIYRVSTRIKILEDSFDNYLQALGSK